MIRGHDSPPEKSDFCTGITDICAAKLRLFWLILPKSPAILLIADLSVLLGVLSWYPVAFRGMLDDIIDLMVIFMVLENIFVPLPQSLRSFGGGCFLCSFFQIFERCSNHLS
jgi:hypothetical protein